MIKIDGIKLSVGADEKIVYIEALKRARLNKNDVKFFRIAKKSIDARDKNAIKYVYSVEISDREENEEEIILPNATDSRKIVIVGFGPAGMFCALYLARAGYKPIVIERGKPVDERKRSIENFVATGKLDVDSNIQFGEGGAGTFSDGKLNTGVSSELIKAVLRDFVKYGAPEEITYLSKPHIGSDNLPKVVKNIRKEIERLGGKVLFNKKLEDITLSNGRVLKINAGETIEVDDLVLAIGHSARDTFYMLNSKGIEMERKAFAIGLRIEHLQEEINISQYGKKFASQLPSADYRLASHVAERGVFTFCMCPGGYVMPSASEHYGVVTNGMSLYARDGQNANSAVLCEVYPSDFYEGVLGGVELQRKYERIAYEVGGGDYSAPVQLFKDYLNCNKTNKLGSVKPTYPHYKFSDLNEVLPENINSCLKKGILDMDKRLKGFACGDAVLTGVETRSSSPVRIMRNSDMYSLSAENLYPCGEGCGYAGGIVSAAIDGIRTAMAISIKYGKR